MDSTVISKYRNAIYGIAAIGILIVHSLSFYQWTGILRIFNKLFIYGGLGVPIFAFLSGMGMFFSLKTSSDKKVFWQHRIYRTFLPYLMIAGLYYAIVYLFISWNPLGFLYELSTLSFWMEHRGAWYIAMVIPVYALIPFYAQWVEKGNKRGEKTIIASTIWFIIGSVVNLTVISLYNHLSLVFRTVFVLMVGYYIGGKVYAKERITFCWIYVPILIYVAQALISRVGGVHFEPLRDVSFAMLGSAVTWILALMLEKIKRDKFLVALGNVSLESYVLNTYLCEILKSLRAVNALFSTGWNGIIFYIVVVVFPGIIFSFLSGTFLKKMLRRV